MTAPTIPVDAQLAALPSLRFEVSEAAQILRMSRAQLYNRIQDGSLKPQKDGSRTYLTRAELERYVQACGARFGSDSGVTLTSR
jgi:excisionase family DNA binding protein